MDDMNVQTQETNVNNVTKPETKANTSVLKEDDKPTPSTASQEDQIQKLLVENAKLKRSFDKAASEASDYKKKYNATLSEQEKASIEKAEEQARRDERLAELEREVSVHKFTESFLDLGYDTTQLFLSSSNHLPIQNLAKISLTKSSSTDSPIIKPREE